MASNEAEFSSLVFDWRSWLQQSKQFLLAPEALIPILKHKGPITQQYPGYWLS